METLLQDVRYALRGLRKTPGFALVAVLTIGLAVGANTSVFTFMERFVLRPVPMVPETDRLVVLRTGAPGGGEWSVSYPDFRVWREGARAFEGITVQSFNEMNVRIDGPSQRAWGVLASWNLFETLRVRAILGRTFRADDETQAITSAVISHAFWQRAFAGDSGVVGRHVMLNNQDFTIIGVLPRRFVGTEVGLSFDLWVPVTVRPLILPGGDGMLTNNGWRWLTAVARLKPGISLAQARQDMQAAHRSLAETVVSDRNTTVLVKRFSDQGAGAAFRPLSGALLGVTLVVLLVACANLANLLLARATARSREIGIRLAVGAGRGRLVRQLLTESLVLALGGGALGLLIALWGRDSIYSFVPASPLPIVFDMPLDARVLGFALAATLVTGLIFGLIPALQASRVDLVPALRDGAATGPARRSRVQATLVGAQVALSLVSLVCAGLFVRGLQRAQAVDIGVRAPGQVLLASTSLFLAGHKSDTTGGPVLERLLAEVRTLPGVRSASVATRVALGFGGGNSSSLDVEGYEFRPDEDSAIPWSSVGADYFATMGTTILQGREFATIDRSGTQPVAVVNEAFARRYWPGRAALGLQIRFSGGDWRTVVGISRDTKLEKLDETPEPFVFVPMLQVYASSFTLHVRADGDPHLLQQSLRRAFERVDPNLPFNDVRTFAENMGAVTFVQDMGASMLTAFGLLALVLAAIGLYGVLSYSVAQRTREMGVRIAIGASRHDVLGLIIGRAMRLTAVGLGVGIVLAAGAGQLLRSQIFGVSPLDPLTFVSVIVLLAAVAFVAAWLPARRAARVDPIVALQSE
jgi:predicted permease